MSTPKIMSQCFVWFSSNLARFQLRLHYWSETLERSIKISPSLGEAIYEFSGPVLVGRPDLMLSVCINWKTAVMKLLKQVLKSDTISDDTELD